MFANVEVWPTESQKHYDCEACGARYRVRVPWMARVPAGHQAWAHANAIGQATRAFEQVAIDRGCPVCNTRPVEMSRDRRLIVGWAAILLILAIPALLLYTVLASGYMPVPSDPLAMAISGALIVTTIVALHVVSRRQSGKRAKNSTAYACELVAEGFARPQTTDGQLAPTRRPYIASCCLCLGLAALLAPETVRLLRGWNSNAEVYPAVCGPGDVVRVQLPNGPLSMEGEWRGEPRLLVAATPERHLEPAEFGLSMPNDGWDGRLDQQNSRVRPWVDVTLPDDPTLANNTLELWLVAVVNYPEMDRDKNVYNDVRTTVERKCLLQLSEHKAGGTYEWVRNISWASASLAVIFGVLGWLVHFLRTPYVLQNLDARLVEIITAT